MVHIIEELSDAVDKGREVVPDLLLKVVDNGGTTTRLLHECTFSNVVSEFNELYILTVDELKLFLEVVKLRLLPDSKTG